MSGPPRHALKTVVLYRKRGIRPETIAKIANAQDGELIEVEDSEMEAFKPLLLFVPYDHEAVQIVQASAERATEQAHEAAEELKQATYRLREAESKVKEANRKLETSLREVQKHKTVVTGGKKARGEGEDA